MKKILFLLVSVMLLAVSCTKEDVNARKIGSVSPIAGTYVGTFDYINYSPSEYGGYEVYEGGTETFLLVVTETDYGDNQLAFTYTDTTDATNSVTYYAKNITEDGDNIYFNIPLQYNEDENEMRGNQCYILELGDFDGVYNKSTGTLKFCTRYDLGFGSYGETIEEYQKQ